MAFGARVVNLATLSSLGPTRRCNERADRLTVLVVRLVQAGLVGLMSHARHLINAVVLVGRHRRWIRLHLLRLLLLLLLLHFVLWSGVWHCLLRIGRWATAGWEQVALRKGLLELGLGLLLLWVSRWLSMLLL